ncbi:MFS transporter [Pseudomonas mangiferae]|uniref:MFS transporter n=1 Tax=Pseudomonas mangiferae TaxID=2593654 RepID=A0A553GUK8_9PSED|nr:MFS transporter [Pseudomonas mangiferae]TRX73171.1 MFS transporter [Pseudomonas mangiferae]
MTEQDYLLAWAIYGIAALGCLLVVFRMTGWMWRWVREPLRLLAAVLLLTPTATDASRDLYAPALAITALDIAFKVGTNVWKAVPDLALYGAIAFIVYLLFALLRWPLERAAARRRAEREAPVEEEDEPTLRELLERENAPEVDTRVDRNGDRRMRIEPRL